LFIYILTYLLIAILFGISAWSSCPSKEIKFPVFYTITSGLLWPLSLVIMIMVFIIFMITMILMFSLSIMSIPIYIIKELLHIIK